MRADARANRRALLDAARTLYASRGAPVPLNAVAQEAGLGIATLYRHFPTQDDLVLGIVEHVRSLILDICDRWLPGMEADPEPAWSGFATEVAALELGVLVPQILHDRDSDAMVSQFTEASSQILTAVDRVVTAAKRAGLVRDDVSTEHFYVGLGAVTRPLPTALTAALPGIGDWLVDVYLRGLRPA